MSKRDLKKYLSDLSQEQVSEQLLELYDKFPDIKTYYDFVFNPKEEKLVADARIKIANEYFPVKSKRPKLRRSTAQKIIKHFLLLGVEAHAVADIMLFSIETAIKYSAKRDMRYASFYKSILNSFEQMVRYTVANGVHEIFIDRITGIFNEVKRQRWENIYGFETAFELMGQAD